MALFDLNNATTTDFSAQVPDFIVESRSLDAVNASGETFVYFDKAKENFGYYFKIPEIYSAANALATWTVGKGWTSETRTKLILEQVMGIGKDTFDSIMWNHEVTKLIVGDAFIEVKRDEGTIINMIPISPDYSPNRKSSCCCGKCCNTSN